MVLAPAFLANLLAFAVFRRPLSLAGAWTGALGVVFAGAVALQTLAPDAALVLAWPLTAAALAFAIAAGGADRHAPAILAVAGVAAFTLAWLGSLFHELLQAIDIPLAAALPAWLASLVIWPLAWPDTERRAWLWPGAALTGLALLIAGVIHWRDPWSPRFPDAVEPLYVVEPGADRAWRASLIPPNAWARRILTAEGGVEKPLALPLFRRPMPAAPAAPVAVAAPLVAEAIGPDGLVTLTVSPHADASEVWLALRPGGPASRVWLNGAPTELALTPTDWSRVRWSGSEGFSLAFRAADPARVSILAGEVHDRWLGASPPPAPPAVDQLWDLADSSLVITPVVPSRP
jgi:hypothetical protein